MSGCATCGEVPKRRHARYCSDACRKVLEEVLLPIGVLLDAEENGDIVLRGGTRALLRFTRDWLSRGALDTPASELALVMESLAAFISSSEEADQQLREQVRLRKATKS